MLARTVLTLLIFTTSTVAGAREPAQPVRSTYSGGLAPALLAARAADPMDDPELTEPTYNDPTYNEPEYSEPEYRDPTLTDPSTGTTTTTPSTTTQLTTPTPTNVRPPRLQAAEWEREKRKLQAQTAVPWVLTGIGIAGVAIPLAMLRACNEADRTRDVDCRQERQAAMIGAPIAGALTVASIIPAIIYSTRLARHNRYSGLARVSPAPGGVMVRF